MRIDFARIWDRRTGEVLRLRPGMLRSDRLEHIGRMSDGRVVLTTLRSRVGQVVLFPTDFEGYLRSVSRPLHMAPLQPYGELYPAIPLSLPDNTDPAGER